MADDPNNQLLPQILAILGAERASEETPNSVSPEHKGIIKDSANKPKELPANLTSTEEGRVRNIGKVLAIAIGQELQIGRFKPGPEAGRLKMDQTKVGSAIGDKGKAPPPAQSSNNSLLDLLKGLGNLAWPALLLAIGTAAAKFYDDLGVFGRGLSKIALKLAPHIGKLTKLGGAIFKGIGKVVDALGSAFKYFSTKGITGFIDDLKAKFPKTSQFIDETVKYFDDFKNWLKKTWVGSVVRSMKSAVRRLIGSIRIGAWNKLMEPIIGGADVNKKLTMLQKTIKSVRQWFFSGINRILNPSAMKALDDLKAAARAVSAGADKAKELGRFGRALKTTMDAVKTVGGWIAKAGGWITSGFSAITEIGGTVLKLFGGAGGGTLGKMLKGTMKFVGKMLQPLLKKLPVIGAVMGLGFAYARFQKGEVLPAILELVSALLTFVPGIGTIGSIVIDGALMLYDLDKQKQEDEAKGIKPAEGGFMSKVKKWVSDWITPVLRYLPVIGSFFYFADSIKAFTGNDMFNGIDNLLKGVIALVGGKGLVDLVNSAYPVITGLFSDKEQESEAEAVGGKKEGGFWSNLKKTIADFILPKLKYLPVIGAFFYGKEAWDAFSNKQWGTGFQKTGQALIALAGGPLGSIINMGIDFITSIFDSEATQEQEVKAQGGGFATAIKGAFDAMIGIVTGAIESMVRWVTDTLGSIATGAAEAVNSVMAKIPGGSYVTAAGEAVAKSVITEPANLTASNDSTIANIQARQKRMQDAAAKYGYADKQQAAKAAGYANAAEWEKAGLPAPKPTFAQAAAPAATSSMVVAPAQQPNTTFAQATAPVAGPSMSTRVSMPTAAAVAPPAAPPAAPTTPSTAPTTTTGAMTAGIMSTFGISQQPTPPMAAQQASIPPGTGGTQARNFKGGQAEAYALARSLAAKAGSPDPDLTASIVMLESGWLKSSMIRRANNPSGQTINRGQIGKEGIIGGTVGGDGQLHAVYVNLEAAFAHHVRRWKSRYVANDVLTSTRNLVAGGYNTVNPAWASHVQNTYRKWSGKQLPAIAQETLSGAAPTAAMAVAPAAASSQMPVSTSFMQASAPAAATPQMPESMPMSASAPVSMDSLSAAAAPPASIPSPIPGGFDQYFNSSAFGAALAARGNVGARQVGGSWKSSGGTTLCAAGAMVVAGMYTKSDAIKKARIGSATNLARNPNNPLTSTGIYKDLGGLPRNYSPVDGDLVAMAGGSKGFGHALVYIGGKWYAHKSGDRTPQQYLSSGKYNSPRLYRLSQAAAASAAIPDEIAGGTGISVAPASADTFGSSGGLFSGMSNLFSGGVTAQSAQGGISNLSTSSTSAPMAASGAETSITSKMDDIASKQISKADEEIGVLKGIDDSIKELAKQISALSRITINNVSGGDSKTSIATANIPDTDSRLKPQTSGGFLGGKMFGFG